MCITRIFAIGVVRWPHFMTTQIAPEHQSRIRADKSVLRTVQTHASSQDPGGQVSEWEVIIIYEHIMANTVIMRMKGYIYPFNHPFIDPIHSVITGAYGSLSTRFYDFGSFTFK